MSALKPRALRPVWVGLHWLGRASLCFSLCVGCKRAEPAPAAAGSTMASALAVSSVPAASSAPDNFWSAMDGGWMGVEINPNEGRGGRVTVVVPESQAARAGLLVDDVILEVQGKPVHNTSELFQLASRALPGVVVTVRYERAGVERRADVPLEAIPSKDELLRRLFVGRPAPELRELAIVPGQPKSKVGPELRGKATVLEFWASWCEPCHLLSKQLKSWQRSGTSAHKQVVGIGADKPALAAKAAREMAMTYPIWSDENGAAARAYRANSLPTLFVIDARGIVRDAVVGYEENRIKAAGELFETLAKEAGAR